MEGELRLFRGATEALVIRASYSVGSGWELYILARHQGEGWQESGPAAAYTHLTTPELYDVLCADLASQLGL